MRPRKKVKRISFVSIMIITLNLIWNEWYGEWFPAPIWIHWILIMILCRRWFNVLIVLRQSHLIAYSHKQKQVIRSFSNGLSPSKWKNSYRNNDRIYAELALCCCCSQFIVLVLWIYATICQMMCERYTNKHCKVTWSKTFI